MITNTKDWTAHIALSQGDEYLEVDGSVTVASHGLNPGLVRSPRQVNHYDLRLDLELETSNISTLQTEKSTPIKYKAYGKHRITGVSIYYDGKLLHHIDKIRITY